jgi:ribonuclease VapC
MVIDTSALIAVLTGEPDAERYKTAIDRDAKRLMSVASILETTIVLESRYGEEGPRELDVLLRRLPIESVPVDCDQLEWARHACRAYGKGRHPAALNFGDCFSYALARLTGEPLLYKGADFARTDIRGALDGQDSTGPNASG